MSNIYDMHFLNSSAIVECMWFVYDVNSIYKCNFIFINPLNCIWQQLHIGNFLTKKKEQISDTGTVSIY